MNRRLLRKGDDIRIVTEVGREGKDSDLTWAGVILVVLPSSPLPVVGRTWQN
jgi:hypothetical protein